MNKYKIFAISIFVIICVLIESSITSTLNAGDKFYKDPCDESSNTVFIDHTHYYQTVNTPPTCISMGFDINTCWCGRNMFTNIIPMLPHDDLLCVVNPTCVENGYTKYSCQSCGRIETKDFTDALDHKMSDWAVTVNPTIFNAGVKSRNCNVCEYTETESVPKITGGVVKLTDNSKNIDNMMNAPSQSTFGNYYSQACAMYDCIKNGNAGSYWNWPSGIYGPAGYAHFTLPISGIDDMSFEEQQVVANNTVRSFESKFNSKVLKNSIHLSMNMWDVVPGGVSIHIDPAVANRKINNQAKEDIFYKTCVNEIGLYNGMSQIDAIYKINNWMCDYISYSSGSDPFEVLKTGQAVCGGYASLFKQLCASAGIKCEYVVGCHHGDPNCMPCHAWNKVQLNGTWYWVDVCWNDTGSNRTEHLLSPVLWSPRIVFG